jgi:pyridoxine 5-phosphate synthase
MIRLSVNVNKVATLRNARGGSVPSVTRAVETCLEAGAPGITVHPRADERHVRASDVNEVASTITAYVARTGRRVEFNVEGDPRLPLMDLVTTVRPDQCTLVPVVEGEITSQAGWAPGPAPRHLTAAIERLKVARVRVSLFVNAEAAPVRWAADLGADRVELYTEPFARAFARGGREGRDSLAAFAKAAELAHSLGMGVNAGHDLDLDNLQLFRELPHLDEVSIGHALISYALWVGLDTAVRDYLAVLSQAANGGMIES